MIGLGSLAVALPLLSLGPIELVNLRVDTRFVVTERHVILTVPETRGDLNGDGDTRDDVYHVLDLTDWTTTNLRIAANRFDVLPTNGDLIALTVPKYEGTNSFDVITYVYRFGDAEAQSLGVCAAPHREFGPASLLLLGSEVCNASDLNGDGDTDDSAVFLYDARSGIVNNLGLTLGGSRPAQAGDLSAFAVSESGMGDTDLNGDGDADDDIIHVLDGATGSLVNLGLHGTAYAYHWSDRQLAFVALERFSGEMDLNGDGTAASSSLFVYDVDRAVLTNVGLAPQGQGSNPTFDLLDGTVALVVSEQDQGMTDLNGDGDDIDYVFMVHDVETAETTNIGLTAVSAVRIGPYSVMAAEETLFDWNGDGDTRDTVLHLHDRVTGVVRNTGRAGIAWPNPRQGRADRVRDDRYLLFQIEEQDEDLNRDGMLYGRVPALLDVREQKQRILPILSGRAILAADVVLIEGRENVHGLPDYNDDGDSDDRVAFLHDTTTGETRNLGVAMGAWGANETHVFVSVFEHGQGGVDLNGDGDFADRVLHSLELASLPGRRIRRLRDGALELADDGRLVEAYANVLGSLSDSALDAVAGFDDRTAQASVRLYRQYLDVYTFLGVLRDDDAAPLAELAEQVIDQLDR